MKTKLYYCEKMTLHILALGMESSIDLGDTTLESALEYVNHIFNDSTMFRAERVSHVHIINSLTGELIATCEPDSLTDKYQYDNWREDDGILYDEDMGFDPYLGCYSDDC